MIHHYHVNPHANLSMMQSATNYQELNENQVYNPIEKQHIACQRERDKEKHSIEVGWGLSVSIYMSLR